MKEKSLSTKKSKRGEAVMIVLKGRRDTDTCRTDF